MVASLLAHFQTDWQFRSLGWSHSACRCSVTILRMEDANNSTASSVRTRPIPREARFRTLLLSREL
jgi:hypothetical protein